ncbi:MAG: ATP-binding protein [Bdellovibrionota bacterium]
MTDPVSPLDSSLGASGSFDQTVEIKTKCVELDSLYELQREFLEHIKTDRSFSDEPKREGIIRAHAVQPDKAAEYVARSVKAVSVLSEFTLFLNRISKSKKDRNPEIGKAIMPLVVACLAPLQNRQNQEKKSQGRKVFIQENASSFFHTYWKSEHPNQYPIWIDPLLPFIKLADPREDLPLPYPYLAQSESAQSIYPDLKQRFDAAEAEYESNKHPMPPGPVALAAKQKSKQVTLKARSLLAEVDDVDPHTVPECVASMEIASFLSADLISAVINMQKDIGQAIQALTKSKQEIKEDRLSVECFEFVYDHGGKSKLEKFTITFEIPVGSEEKKELLASLLSAYIDLRKVTLDNYNHLYSEQKTEEVKYRNQLLELNTALQEIFVGNSDESCRAVISLAESKDSKIQLLIPKLLIAQATRGGNSFESPSFAIGRVNNLELIGPLVDHLISGDSESAASIGKLYDTTNLSSVILLCQQIRTHIENSDIRKLAHLLDFKIEGQIKSTIKDYIGSVGLLYSLVSIAGNRDLVKKLKGRLKKRKEISPLCDAIKENKETGASLIGRPLESARATINQAFSFTLDDYIGQEELITDIKAIFDKNERLNREPERWEGIPPKLAFKNGIALTGVPGVGKSFLVECIANHYGLLLERISREEMDKVIKNRVRKNPVDREVTNVKHEDLQLAIANFVDAKIQELRTKMDQSGQSAGMLFIDEMEVEFLKRDASLGSRDEFEHTNVMLRVLEEAMEKNPDIFFLAACNHKEMVDDAALRFGRFGIHFEITIPNERDIQLLAAHAFEVLELDFETISKESRYKELLEECKGLTPLPILNAIVSSYVTRPNFHEKLSLEEIIANAITEIKFMKKHTTTHVPRVVE